MQEERDIVVFSDDDGNDFEMEVMDYFFYNGQEYAVLMDAKPEEEGCGCGCGHDHDHDHGHDHEHGEDCDCEGAPQDVYIMKVTQVGDDMEEFVPVEEGLMDELITIVQTRFDADFDDEGLDEEDDEDEEEEEDEE